MIKILFIGLIFMVINLVSANEIKENIVLSYQDETLLSFPANIMASICRNQLASLELVNNEQSSSKLIRLVPQGKKDRNVKCSFKLEDGSIYYLDIFFKKDVFKPFVDFKKININKHGGEGHHLKAFLNLISEHRNYIFQRKELPKKRNKRTDNHYYSIIFQGLVGPYYGLVLSLKEKYLKMEFILKNVPFEKIYYSALGTHKKRLYILTKKDFQWVKIKEHLP